MKNLIVRAPLAPAMWESRRTPADFPFGTVRDLVVERGAEFGDALFLIDDATGERYAYAQVAETARRVAAGLAERGVEKGDRVAVLLPNAPAHVFAWLGSAMLGAIYAPVNPAFTGFELRRALADLDAEAVVLDGDHLDGYESVRDEFSIPTEVLRGSGLDGAVAFDDLARTEPSPPDVPVEPSDPSTIIFSSGTTGKPKPILLSQFAPLTGAYRYRAALEPDRSDRHFCVLKLFHVAGQQFGVLGPMLSGTSTVLCRRFGASSFFDDVNRNRATIADTAGGMLGALLQTYDDPVRNDLHTVFGMLDEEPHGQARKRFDVDVLECWGLTEGGGVPLTYSYFDPERTVAGAGKPVGRFGDWIEIGILDEDGGRLGTDEVGEICIRPTIPHSVMDRYYGYPEATLEAWDGLWIHTGDVGRVDAEDRLYYVGRKAHWIKRMGENVSAYEVEGVLDDHDAVAESAVVGVPNEEIGGEDVKAFVRPAGERPDPDALVEWCRDRLSGFKLPRYVEFVEEFPRSATKKEVQRHVLRDRGVDGAWDREPRGGS